MLVVNTLTMLTIAHTDRGGPYRLHMCTLNKCTRSILFKCEEIEYDIQFFSCSCLLTKSERQKIIRKHKSTTQKRLLADKSRGKCKNVCQRATEAKFNPLLHDLDNYISRFHNKRRFLYLFCLQPITLQGIGHDVMRVSKLQPNHLGQRHYHVSK